MAEQDPNVVRGRRAPTLTHLTPPSKESEVPTLEETKVAEPITASATASAPAADPGIASLASSVPAGDRGIARLALLVSGCRSDGDGIEAKKALVAGFIKDGSDVFHAVCALHLAKVITVEPAKLLKVVKWRAAPTPASNAQSVLAAQQHDGYFLAQALSLCNVADMDGMVQAYIHRNPHADQIELLQYVNELGFVSYKEESVFAVVDWEPPAAAEADPTRADKTWRKLWGERIPEGKPWYATLRDARGRRTQLAFLGSVSDDATSPTLAPPSQIVMGQWKVPQPSLCLVVDAGSMHPQQCDSISQMAHLPQFHEWYLQNLGASESLGATSEHDGSSQAPITIPSWDDGAQGRAIPMAIGYDDGGQRSPPADNGEGVDSGEGVGAPSPPPSPPAVLDRQPTVRLEALLKRTLEQWRISGELPKVETDQKLGDSSINNIIFSKLKEVFSAMLDAATLGGSWVVVDRTDGSGSATAELLLEMAVARGTSRPVVLVIDSLERLGGARDGARAIKTLMQLRECFLNEDCTTQAPTGAERDFLFNFQCMCAAHMPAYGAASRVRDALTTRTRRQRLPCRVSGLCRRFAGRLRRRIQVCED